jgi:hypothetical protein
MDPEDFVNRRDVTVQIGDSHYLPEHLPSHASSDIALLSFRSDKEYAVSSIDYAPQEGTRLVGAGRAQPGLHEDRFETEWLPAVSDRADILFDRSTPDSVQLILDTDAQLGATHTFPTAGPSSRAGATYSMIDEFQGRSGMSGGPLYDRRGRAVAVLTNSDGDGADGTRSWAAPLSLVRGQIEEWHGQTPSTPTETYHSESFQALGPPTAVINESRWRSETEDILRRKAESMQYLLDVPKSKPRTPEEQRQLQMRRVGAPQRTPWYQGIVDTLDAGWRALRGLFGRNRERQQATALSQEAYGRGIRMPGQGFDGIDSRIGASALGGLHSNLDSVLMAVRGIEAGGDYGVVSTSHAHTGYREDQGPYQEGYFDHYLGLGASALELNPSELSREQQYDVAAVGRLSEKGLLDDILAADLSNESDRLRVGSSVAQAWGSRYAGDADYHQRYADMIGEGHRAQSRSGGGDGTFVSAIQGGDLVDMATYEPSFQQGMTGVRPNGRIHSKVDFDARIGAGQDAGIQAMEAGQATYVPWTPTSGMVRVDTTDADGRAVSYEYGHLSLASIRETFGDQTSIQVGAGDRLGAVTVDALSRGAHLDLGVRVDGAYVDPQAHIRDRMNAPATSSQTVAAPTAGNGLWRDRDQIHRNRVDNSGVSGGGGSSSNRGPIELSSQFSDINQLIPLAIGHSEGNRTLDGGFTQYYAGHTDPGNSAQNVGNFSAQTGPTTAAEADTYWLGRLSQITPLYERKAREAGLDPNDPLLAATMYDLYVQAPAAVMAPNENGFLNQLPRLAQEGITPANLVEARVRSYRNPRTGNLETTFASEEALRTDQARRVRALEAVINEHGPIAPLPPGPQETTAQVDTLITDVVDGVTTAAQEEINLSARNRPTRFQANIQQHHPAGVPSDTASRPQAPATSPEIVWDGLNGTVQWQPSDNQQTNSTTNDTTGHTAPQAAQDTALR